MKSYRLFILDRDGVINHDSDAYIKSANEWQPIAGSLEAIARLKAAQRLVAVASNQAGIARGKFTEADLAAMHQKMTSLTETAGGQFDHVTYCTDGPDSGSPRRKPEPGMLLEILAALEVLPEETLFIGDSYSDYRAAERAGCDFALVRTGKGERTLAAHNELCHSVPVYDSLAHLVSDMG